MEEKERYVIRYDLDYNQCLIDTEKNQGVGDYIQIVKLLNQQSKRIKELENENQQLKQQLKEKDKDIKYFKESYYMIQDEKDHYAGQCLNLQDRIEELEKNNKRIQKNWKNSKTQQTRLYNNLKQQLHDLPKKIVEDIEKNFTEYLPLKDKTGAWFYGKLNEILKKYGVEDE